MMLPHLYRLKFVLRVPVSWRNNIKNIYDDLRVPCAVGIIAGAISIPISYALPNQYRSEARLLSGDTRSSSGGAAAAAAAATGISLPGAESPDAAYVDILNSRSLREELLRTVFTYKSLAWSTSDPSVQHNSLYHYFGKKNMDRAVKSLKTCVTVSRDLKTKLITITAETTSPDLSKQVVDRMIVLLNEFLVNKARTRGNLKAEFSTKRMEEARSELMEAEKALRAFLDINRNYSVSPDPSIRLSGLRLENELKLRTQVLSTLAVGREQALLEEKNDMPILNILDQGNLPVDKSGPPRAEIMFITFILSGTVVWIIRKNTKN